MLYNEYVEKRRQYQEMGRDLLLRQKHACLFFSPGKGKTYPTIDALREIDKQKGGNARVLIISSCDAIKKMWEPEIVPQHILPKNTTLITDRKAIMSSAQALLASKWDVILVDECHILKSNSSKIHKLVYKLCKNVEYAWGLTGTPRGNSDIDIWVQLQALNVADQGRLSYSAWTHTCCEFETGYGAYGQFQKPVKIKSKYLGWWNGILDEYCMFVDYEEDDDMPDLNIQVVNVPYVKSKEYKDAINGIIEVGDYSTTTQKMVAITKAHQVCNGYIYLPDKTIYRLSRNQKLDTLQSLVGDSSCVVVYKYLADYEDLTSLFGTDATSDIELFKKGGKNILLLQCGECKSFNLQDACSTIIFYTMDYSFIKYKQMIHRCWRLGQKRETKIYVLIAKGTVEKSIWSAVKDKQHMHDLYMNIKKEAITYG